MFLPLLMQVLYQKADFPAPYSEPSSLLFKAWIFLGRFLPLSPRYPARAFPALSQRPPATHTLFNYNQLRATSDLRIRSSAGSPNKAGQVPQRTLLRAARLRRGCQARIILWSKKLQTHQIDWSDDLQHTHKKSSSLWD